MKKCLIGIACVSACLVGSTNAALIAQYNFGTGLTSSDTELNSTATGITLTLLNNSGRDSGVGNPAGSLQVHKNNMATAQDLTRYIEFTITAANGYALNLNGNLLTFDSSRNGGTPTAASWGVRSSVDGFAANLATGTSGTSGWTGGNVALTGNQFNGLTTITFRIYSWESGVNEHLFYDNINLNGSLTPVPEPANIALGIFGLGSLAAFLVRRFRKSQQA